MHFMQISIESDLQLYLSAENRLQQNLMIYLAVCVVICITINEYTDTL